MSFAKLVPAPIPRASDADGILELGFLVTATDGHIAPEELRAFGEVLTLLRGRPVPQEEIDELLGRFLMTLQATLLDDRVRELSAALPGDLRELAFKIVIGLTLVEHEENEQEDELVGLLAASLGLAERSIPLTAEARAAFDQ
ncbi:MAG: hypothetical protein JWP97_2993 [Labilithrix sp.]|nr:hypothetical protein [Labilithrix sp.]